MSKNYKKNKSFKPNSKFEETKKDFKKGHSKEEDPRNQKSHQKEDVATKYSERKGTTVDSYVGSGNDPKWYNRNTRLITDATKIPFGYQLGAPLHYHSHSTVATQMGYTFPDFAVPSVLALSMVNIPGIARDATDGVNLATSGLFQFIRKNLSTTASYAPADVMMYTLGIDEIYSMYSNILRIFGIINAYSAINITMPNLLLSAAYNFDNEAIAAVKTMLNNYRAWFNNLIFKASTLYLPTDFTLTSRHAWLYSNYFMDGNSSKAQIYIHSMYAHHIIDETSSTNGTMLKTVLNSDTLAGLLQQFDDMIECYRNSDSMLKIAADMRRAFEGRSQWKLAYVDEGYIILPTYNEDVLSQIHNTTINPLVAFGTSLAAFDVTQDVNRNIVLCAPTLTVTTAAAQEVKASAVLNSGNVVLNFHKDNVTSDDILEATRNTNRWQVKSTTPTAITFDMGDAGVDLCVDCNIFVNGDENTASFNLQSNCSGAGETIGFQIPGYNACDWAPQYYVAATIGEVTNYYAAFDLENYTVIDPGALNMLNRNVICSMFSIPEFGGYDA